MSSIVIFIVLLRCTVFDRRTWMYSWSSCNLRFILLTHRLYEFIVYPNYSKLECRGHLHEVQRFLKVHFPKCQTFWLFSCRLSTQETIFVWKNLKYCSDGLRVFFVAKVKVQSCCFWAILFFLLKTKILNLEIWSKIDSKFDLKKSKLNTKLVQNWQTSNFRYQKNNIFFEWKI